MKKEHRNWVVLENILFVIVFTLGLIWLCGGPRFIYYLFPKFYTDICMCVSEHTGAMAIFVGILLYMLHICITGIIIQLLFLGIFKLCDVNHKDSDHIILD